MKLGYRTSLEMDAENNEITNNNYITQSGDSVVENPEDKKDINSTSVDDLADNNNIILPEGGEGQEGGAMALEDQDEGEDNNNVEVVLSLIHI